MFLVQSFCLFHCFIGTGKTLSIICSALQWVVDKREQDKLKKEVEAKNSSVKGGELGSDDEPDWMRNAVVNKDIQGEEKKSRKKDKFGSGFRRAEKGKDRENCSGLFSRRVEEESCKKKEGKGLQVSSDAVEVNDEDEFLLDEHESDEEGIPCVKKSKRKVAGVSLSSSSDEEDGADGSSDDEDEGEENLKVYFCSRTHSQLSQFIKELRKTVFANEMKVVCLGSRKNFCINQGMKFIIRLLDNKFVNCSHSSGHAFQRY